MRTPGSNVRPAAVQLVVDELPVEEHPGLVASPSSFLVGPFVSGTCDPWPEYVRRKTSPRLEAFAPRHRSRPSTGSAVAALVSSIDVSNPAPLRDRGQVVGVVLAALQRAVPALVVVGIDGVEPDVQ